MNVLFSNPVPVAAINAARVSLGVVRVSVPPVVVSVTVSESFVTLVVSNPKAAFTVASVTVYSPITSLHFISFVTSTLYVYVAEVVKVLSANPVKSSDILPPFVLFIICEVILYGF